MATDLQVGDIYELRLVCSALGQVSINRIYLTVTEIMGLSATDVDLADALDTSLSGTLKAIISAAATYNGLSVQRAAPTPKTVPVVNKDSAGPGDLLGELLPPQVCSLTALKTDFAGRDKRGRKYWPFATESFNGADGKPVPIYLNSVNALAIKFTVPITVAGPGGLGVDEAELVYAIWRPGSATPFPITSITNRDVWATQRRRALTTSGDALPF